MRWRIQLKKSQNCTVEEIGKELGKTWAICSSLGFTSAMVEGARYRVDYLTDERQREKVGSDILTTWPSANNQHFG